MSEAWTNPGRSDWKAWVEREDVTLRERTALTPTYTDHALSATGGAAKRRALTYKEIAASNGVYSHDNLVWLLPDENLPSGVTPRIGYRIKDADDYEYTVLEVQAGKWGQTHRCVTVCLELVAALDQTASILRPDATKDDGGRPALTTYATLHSGVACRLQPTDSVRGEALGRATSPHRFTCYADVAAETLRARDVLVVGGQRYTIDALRLPARLDRLPEIDCTLID